LLIQDLDLNDPQTLQFYSELLLFKDDHTREALIFPSTLTPGQRRIVHTLAHHMQLSHISRGNGDQRQVHIIRAPPGSSISPPLAQSSTLHGDSSRRVLNRAATTDFSESRGQDPNLYGTLRGQQSTGFLGIPDSPGGFGSAVNLRAAKSFADLRSYTPSPVPSTASFPVGLQSNIARFTGNGEGPSHVATSMASMATTMPSSISGLGIASQRDDTSLLINGLGNMGIGTNNGSSDADSPRRLRGMFSRETTSNFANLAAGSNSQSSATPSGPIGSNRGFVGMGIFVNTGNDMSSNGTLPMRQPRGPIGERGPGFGRIGATNGRVNGHQTRGSDELRNNGTPKVSEIIVE
jgi:hypothetical protein